jgi:putative transposase
MCRTKNCYEICIDKAFLLSKKLERDTEQIVSQLSLKAKNGRPPLDLKRGLNGIYYLLKTGVQWNALPRCFGSSSAVHRLFQKLVSIGFFEKLWTSELAHYDKVHGLNLDKQAMDCAHKKSPLAGCEKTGKSPVDRGKLGSKLSVVSDAKGIIIGLAVGAGNQHDSKLFIDTLKSIPKFLNQPRHKEMNLDSAYDSEQVRIILFNFNYLAKIAPNRRNRKQPLPNPLGYSRWFIEPVHSWLNRFRAVFVRYSKRASNYLGLTQFAAATSISNKILV